MYPPAGKPVWNLRALWHYDPIISRMDLEFLKNSPKFNVERLLLDPKGSPVYIRVRCHEGRYAIHVLTLKGSRGLYGNVSLYDVCEYLHDQFEIITIP